jgi:hypothetical protein
VSKQVSSGDSLRGNANRPMCWLSAIAFCECDRCMSREPMTEGCDLGGAGGGVERC